LLDLAVRRIYSEDDSVSPHPEDDYAENNFDFLNNPALSQ
jgi:hypothetical protein